MVPYLLISVLVLWFHWPGLGGYFILDDWDLLGPRVAQEFLDHPLSIVNSLMATGTPHYAPVARLAYALLSLLFGTNPFPYHLFCLGVVALAGILLYRYLRILGVSLVPSFFATAFFSVAVSHQQVPLWVTLLNYSLVAVFFLAGLIQWEAWLRGEGGRKPLVLTYLFLALALYTHSLGVLFPFLLGLRAVLAGGGRPGKQRLAAAGGLAMVTLVLEGVPRVFLPGGGGNSTVNTDVPLLLKLLKESFLERTIPGFLGISGSSGPSPFTFPAALLAGATCIFLLAWVVRRRHWRLAVMGVLLALGGWILPLVLIKDPAGVALRYRFHYLPDLGYAFVLAALFDFPHGIAPARITRWLRWVPAAVLALFLVQTLSNLPVKRDSFEAQDKLLRQAATGYVRRVEALLRDTPCGLVTIYDTSVEDWVPEETIKKIGNYDLAYTDHARIHRFYFGHRPEMMSRVRFLLYRTSGNPRLAPTDCSYIAWGGNLFPVK